MLEMFLNFFFFVQLISIFSSIERALELSQISEWSADTNVFLYEPNKSKF